MTTRPGYIWSGTEWVEIGQSAVIAPISYQASAPSTPATGDIWIDSDDEVPSVDSTLYYRWTKTMSGGETSLSGTDNNSLSLQYTPGYESVFINGVLQVRNLDYTATSGSTIAGLTALASNDVVMVESIIAYSVGDTYTQSQISSLLDAKSPVSTTGLVLLSTSTFTAQASVSFNNVFSATYDNYKILYTQTAQSADNDVFLRLRASGTDNTTSNYVTGNVKVGSDVSFGLSSNNNVTDSKMIFVIAGTNSAFGTIDLSLPFAASNKRLTATGAGRLALFTGGNINIGTSCDGFTIFPFSGTITGTIKVYGYK
jgi:hypothetical protein